MLKFRKQEIGDMKEFAPLMKAASKFACDVSFTTSFLWGKEYNLRVCRYKDFILRGFEEEHKIISYAFPVGIGNPKEVLDIMIYDSKERNINPLFVNMSQEQKEFIENNYQNKFEFKEQKNNEDYIYLTEKLINLKGKKYHGKRNHIAKFKKTYKNYYFKEITVENMSDALYVCNKWYKANNMYENGNPIGSEYNALKRAFNNYNILDMRGGILYIDDIPVAMTVGHALNNNVFDINFEKALIEYTGAYTMINCEFAKALKEYKYINREEDLGIEGLRKSKLSYYPEFLITKYSAKMTG